MRWKLDWGVRLKQLLKIEESTGQRVAALDRQPILDRWLEPVFDAFWELCNSRASGFGSPQPIQAHDIKAWLDLNDVTGENARRYYRLIRAADGEYMEWWTNKNRGHDAN